MSKRNYSRMVFQFVLIALVWSCLNMGQISSVFASNSSQPRVVITIGENGVITQEGNLLGGGQLFPSTVQQAENNIGGINGVIRINNLYDTIQIDGIGVKIPKDQIQIRNDFPRDIVYESFLDNVRIKIQKETSFSNTMLMNYSSFKNLVVSSSSNNGIGFVFPKGDQFSMKKGDTVDLKYTVHMKEESGNELQKVTANIEFTIPLHQNGEVKGVTDELDDVPKTGLPLSTNVGVTAGIIGIFTFSSYLVYRKKLSF